MYHEYKFAYSIASYLSDVSHQLNQLINSLVGIGEPSGVLKAVHARIEQIAALQSNRLSIIQVAAEHSLHHAN